MNARDIEPSSDELKNKKIQFSEKSIYYFTFNDNIEWRSGTCRIKLLVK